MRVAVLGANGQLGSDLVRHFSVGEGEVFALTHADIRVEDADSVRSALAPLRPDLVLNTAAEHHVERCEEQPARTFEVNAAGALNVARVSAELGAGTVYFSTDYVFDGQGTEPYLVDQQTAPLSVYGASKVAGETLTLLANERAFVVRTGGLYGRDVCRAKGENFVVKMERLAAQLDEVRVVDDQIVSPTPTHALARWVAALVGTGEYGVHHLTAAGSCSWFEFARAIFSELQLSTPLSPVSSDAFPSAVARPAYSVLDNSRYDELGLVPRTDWRDGLREHLELTSEQS